MNNTEASEKNVKSPSTYGNEAYQEYRKKERKKIVDDAEKESLGHDIAYSKYAVGGESKEVPASPELKENDSFQRQEDKAKGKNSRKNSRKK